MGPCLSRDAWAHSSLIRTHRQSHIHIAEEARNWRQRAAMDSDEEVDIDEPRPSSGVGLGPNDFAAR
jgi:hypothetical protein